MWSPHVILFLPLPSTNSANTVAGRGWDAARRAICRWGAPVGARAAPFPGAPVASSVDATREQCGRRWGAVRTPARARDGPPSAVAEAARRVEGRLVGEEWGSQSPHLCWGRGGVMLARRGGEGSRG